MPRPKATHAAAALPEDRPGKRPKSRPVADGTTLAPSTCWSTKPGYGAPADLLLIPAQRLTQPFRCGGDHNQRFSGVERGPGEPSNPNQRAVDRVLQQLPALIRATAASWSPAVRPVPNNRCPQGISSLWPAAAR